MKNRFLLIIIILSLFLGYFPLLAALDARNLKVPLYFIENRGQVDRQVKFYGTTDEYNVWITDSSIHFSSSKGVSADSIEMVFAGSRKWKVVPVDRADYTVNYFKSKNPSEWRRKISTYKKLRLVDVYPGIDLVLYGKGNYIEYDWEVSPGADPGQIRVKIKGGKVSQGKDRSLIISSGSFKLIKKPPEAYQEKHSRRERVKAEFVILEENEFGIRLGRYDKRKKLIIDPLIFPYSTYLGGSSYEYSYGMAVDNKGYIYVAGWTYSSDFPVYGGFQCASGGYWDAFITKFSPDGSTAIFSSYIGGSNYDVGYSVAVDEDGYIYVGGASWSDNFPIKNAIQPARAGAYDNFITKILPDGSDIVFSTYLGGNDWDWIFQLTVKEPGGIYATGVTRSSNFPLVNPFQSIYGGNDDAFVLELSSDGSTLLFSSYLGGSGEDGAYGIVVDEPGYVYIAGYTDSPDFPVKDAFQPHYAGGSKDGFVTKIFPATGSIVYSSYIGGSKNDKAHGIAVEDNGKVYITGTTDSTDFPVLNALQPSNAGGEDFFVAKLSSQGRIIYSSYLGGSDNDVGVEISVNFLHEPTIIGFTHSSDFPVKEEIQKDEPGSDIVVVRLNKWGTGLVFSTYIGGSGDETGCAIALNKRGDVYGTGRSQSVDFPMVSPFQSSNNGNYDGVVFRLNYNYIPVAVIDGENKVCPVPVEVDISGEKSHDEDGWVKAYRWRIISKPEGSAAYIKDPTSKKTFFVADKAGVYRISLKVLDNDNSWSEEISKSILAIEGVGPKIDITGTRGKERAWIIRKDYVNITVNIFPSSLCAAPVSKYVIYKRKGTGDFSVYRELMPSDLKFNGKFYIYSFLDKYLEKGVSYTYRVVAVGDNGKTLSSGENTF